MTCNNCGNLCNEDELYCRNCGYIIKENMANKNNILIEKKAEKVVKQNNIAGIISIIIPIITILLLVFKIVDFSIYVILLLVSGILFADQVKTSNKDLSYIGKALNIICMIVLIVVYYLIVNIK